MCDASTSESETGSVVFSSLGTVGFSDPDVAAEAPPPPGYATLVAVSSTYGLTCFADAAGLCAIATARLAEVTESLSGKLAREQIVPSDDFARVPMPDLAHVSFCPDETVLAACAGGEIHLFQTRDLLDAALDPRGLALNPPAPFRTQTLGDEDADEKVRDLLWMYGENDRPFGYLAHVAPGEDVDAGKLLVGSAATIDSTSPPVAIAEKVRCAAVAPPNGGGPPVVAWAPAEGGLVVAIITDGGYSAEMKPFPVGPIEDEDGGEARAQIVDGVRFGPRPGLTLLLSTSDAEDPDVHRLLVFDFGPSPVEAPSAPFKRAELFGGFDAGADEALEALRGPFLHACAVAPWGVALASHRLAWDNQVCAIRCPGQSGERAATPCVLTVEDDRFVPSVPLAGEDEEDNFVVGLCLDRTGCGGRMRDPRDASRPKLPQGPLAVVATADRRITLMRVGNTEEQAAMEYEAACVRPPRAEVPTTAALAGSAPPSAEKKTPQPGAEAKETPPREALAAAKPPDAEKEVSKPASASGFGGFGGGGAGTSAPAGGFSFPAASTPAFSLPASAPRGPRRRRPRPRSVCRLRRPRSACLLRRPRSACLLRRPRSACRLRRPRSACRFDAAQLARRRAFSSGFDAGV